MKGTTSIWVGLAVSLLVAPAMADWEPDQPAKWVQFPDLTTTGIDINASDPYILGDDFECTMAGPITDIHIWGSWLHDILPENDPHAVTFSLAIYSDIPSEQSPTGYSMPGELRWERVFQPGEFTARIWAENLAEGWLDPPDAYLFPGDSVCWQYNFLIDPADAFYQEGTPDVPIVYWLVVRAWPQDPQALFGWKTSLDHWNDDAVWDIGNELPRQWQELRYPPQHPMYPESIDLAFVITTEEQEVLDLGDAPEFPVVPTYPTTLVNNGARHVIVTGVFLGAGVDDEPDGQPEPAALGDDNDIDPLNPPPNFDDEDGVTFGPLVPGQMTTVTVVASVPGVLNAWLDWEGDNSWAEAGNQIFTNQPLVAGANPLNLLVPNTAAAGMATFARFRFTTVAPGTPLSYTGLANDGEVEDYEVFIEEPPPVNPAFEFSLDIGSDTEMSDPYMDGDEVFDPGDVYMWQGPSSPMPRNGFKDDFFIFAFDPIPDPLLAGSIVPVGNGDVGMYGEFWDLDGHDELDFPLEQVEYPFSMIPSTCVYPIGFLAVSYDDDLAPGWPAFFNVPVTSPSPAGISSYGESNNLDEVVGVDVGPGPLPGMYSVIRRYPIAAESMVHPDMALNPEGGERYDDDVDSLDVRRDDGAPCDWWLFSPDHEAHLGLDPGGIYQVWLPGGTGTPPLQVVDEAFHLGLSEDTDIDAFEFVWADDPQGVGPVLALLFSVDDDDPLTPLPVDESGGLDPRMIYISFLTGTHAPALDEPLEDDVDALTNAWDSMELPPQVVKWESVKEHGGGIQPVARHAIPLDHWTGFGGPGVPAASVEPRRFEAAGKVDKDWVIITFNTDISALHLPGNVILNVSSTQLGATGTIQLHTETVGGPGNNQLILELDMIGETQYFEAYCVDINISGSIAGLTGDGDCRFRVQYGNVAGGTPPDLATNLIDYAQVKGNNGVDVTDPLNPLYAPTKADMDWNLDGKVNLIDAAEVKVRNGRTTLTNGCP